MRMTKFNGLVPIFYILTLIHFSFVYADGGYFSSESVAVSADQRAIIIQNGNEISMTFSTGYTGEGENFGWIIPVLVPPDIEDVSEAGENGEAAFEMLDKYTAPVVSSGRGCFPAGTEVLTESGSCAIETVEPGTKVYSCNIATGEWVLKRVLKRLTHHYEGDIIAIQLSPISVQATGNHPFYVMSGDRLFSRPLPQDIPKEEQRTTGGGRWVEARDLKEGDVLQDKDGEGLIITSLLSWHEKTEVYNLNVEDYHNYAVHQKGILVHNKGSKEETSESEPLSLVTVYGTVTLEHYEVSILGAAAASPLLDWLQSNGYEVDRMAERVLDAYIRENWAFVAVKLNPGERRYYENEFLPPLTIKYHHDRLVFPLRISSISTEETARITLYVIAESTVNSSNLSTNTLRFKEELFKPVHPESYIESCIRNTLGDDRAAQLLREHQLTVGEYRTELVVIWSGGTPSTDWPNWQQKILDRLMKTPFPEDQKSYMTRLETRMEPASMTEDIMFVFDSDPKHFRVYIKAYEGFYTDLTAAARDGDTDAVQKLLQQGADVNEQTEDGWTALVMAARGGHTEIVNVLLQVGAQVNIIDSYGMTALKWAKRERHTEIVQLLQEAGAELRAREYYFPGIMEAAKRGHKEVVKILLEAGADVDARDENGWTALMRAASSGHIEVVQILLDVGADVDARDENGGTALMEAVGDGHMDVVEILLKEGADVNAREDGGWTALMAAVEWGFSWAGMERNAEILRMLLKAGADVDARSDADGMTALMLLGGNWYYSQPKIVSILIEAGADVNTRNDNGETSLIMAAGEGHTEIVQMLVQAGADVNVKNNDGKSALMFAREKGHTTIVDILIKAGVKE